jgi:hypothetical protein
MYVFFKTYSVHLNNTIHVDPAFFIILRPIIVRRVEVLQCGVTPTVERVCFFIHAIFTPPPSLWWIQEDTPELSQAFGKWYRTVYLEKGGYIVSIF